MRAHRWSVTKNFIKLKPELQYNPLQLQWTNVLNLDDQNQESLAAAPFDEFLAQCKLLPLNERRQLIRDVQYEASSAWMFYMGVHPEKQVLLYLDRISTFPLSLARLCAHVIVYGLVDREKSILATLARMKGIDNFTCVAEMESLATKFDLIILLGENRNRIFSRRMQEIQKFIHADTEIWTLAGNRFSPANIKSRIKKFFRKTTANKTHKFAGAFADTQNQANIRIVKSQFKRLGVVPFASVGSSPNCLNPRTIKPVNGTAEQLSKKYSYPFRQRWRTEEFAVGAAERELTQSFLTRLLEAMPNSALSSGEMIDFAVFPGGKVHIFAEFNIAAKAQPIVIKLPLNSHAVKRAKVNQMTLGYITSSEVDVLRDRVPPPVAAGKRDNPTYFGQPLGPGTTIASLPDFRRNAQSLVMQVFPFWLSVQRGFASEVMIDAVHFEQLIAHPVSSALQFIQKDRPDAIFEKKLFDYLRHHFLDQRFILSLGHGDFSAKNILFDQQQRKITGVIDWDMARLQTFPILDVFHFFLHIRRSTANAPKAGTLLKIMLADKLFRKILGMYTDAFSFEETKLKPLLIVYWAARLAGHLGTIKYLDDGFVRRNYHEPLQVIKKIIDE